MRLCANRVSAVECVRNRFCIAIHCVFNLAAAWPNIIFNDDSTGWDTGHPLEEAEVDILQFSGTLAIYEIKLWFSLIC